MKSDRLNYKVLFINLDHSLDRLEVMKEKYSEFVEELLRIPAVYGRYLPLIAGSKLVDGQIKKAELGRLGCMLSHFSCWEYIVDNSVENTLIIEDDTYPLRPLPIDFNALDIPADYDLCFANGRMVFGLESIDTEYVTTSDAIKKFPDNHNAPGTDGYFISNRGAANLLRLFERDGFGGFIDWRLLAYSVERKALDELPDHHTGRVVVEMTQSSLRTEETIRSYVLKSPLINTDSSHTIVNESLYE